MNKIYKVILIIIACALVILFASKILFQKEEEKMDTNLIVTSSAFENGESIPSKYSGYGDEISPPITIGDIEEASESIAIIMVDLDTPIGTICHWVLWNIPAQTHEIPENITSGKIIEVLGNANQGRNILRKMGYTGPKPPWGTHRYLFRVYVLDTTLDIKEGSSQKKVEKAMEGHILQYGELMGTYKR